MNPSSCSRQSICAFGFKEQFTSAAAPIGKRPHPSFFGWLNQKPSVDVLSKQEISLGESSHDNDSESKSVGWASNFAKIPRPLLKLSPAIKKLENKIERFTDLPPCFLKCLSRA